MQLYSSLLLPSIILVCFNNFIISLGPGTYYSNKKWPESKSVERINSKYQSKRHKDLVVRPTSRAPSIPARKPPTNAYSGLGDDTVGPACYNPKEENIKAK